MEDESRDIRDDGKGKTFVMLGGDKFKRRLKWYQAAEDIFSS